MSDKIIAYKGMNADMICRGKQYEIGKTYTEPVAKCCSAGMHACENPLDVLHYYPLADGSRIFKVECGGDISREDKKDTKLACTELTVEAEIKIADMVKLGVKAVMDRVNKKVKEAEKIASGDYSTGAASGNYSTGAASGEYCKAEALGKDSIAVANGVHSQARGAMGCYLVLTEYADDGNMICAKMSQVDGKTIKENVWYTLKNGEFVEAQP